MKADLYTKGRVTEIDVTNVYPEDEAFFEENKVRISVEELQNSIVIYADYGATTPDGEPDEAIVIAGGRTCEDTLQALRTEVQSLLKLERKLP